MHEEPHLKEAFKEWHGSLHGYWYGFGSSLFFTFISFLLVYARFDIPDEALISTIIGLAVVQAAAQVIFFLHVGQEPKPRWESLVFSFMVLVLFIIVLGTLWIMHDLNHRVMNM